MLQMHLGAEKLLFIRNKFRLRKGEVNVAKFSQLHQFPGFAAIRHGNRLFFLSLVVIVNVHKNAVQNFTLHFQLHFLLHFKTAGIAVLNGIIGILGIAHGVQPKTDNIPSGQRQIGAVQRQRKGGV